MAILVVMLHACPLLDISELADYYSSKGITRIAVPYFFVASGFFLFRKMPKGIFEWDILNDILTYSSISIINVSCPS